MKNMNQNITSKIVLILIFLACLWGGNAVAMKIALRDMPPIFLAGLRFTLGIFGITLWSMIKKIDLKLQRKDIPPFILLSFLFVVQIITFNLGTKYTTASRASLLINTNPFFIAVLAHFFMPDDKLTVRKSIGLILAFLGILVVFRDKIDISENQLKGDIIMLISGFLWAVMTIYTKRLMQNYNVYKLLLWQMIFGLIPFYGISLIFERSSRYTITSSLVISLLYQGIMVATIAFIIWMVLLQRHNASKLSAFLFATPLFGVGLSALILNEPLTIYLIIGSILVAAGIYIVNKCPDGFRICN